jgi:hypothetical protein
MWEVVPNMFAAGLLGWRVTAMEPGKPRYTQCIFMNKDKAVCYAASQCHFYWKALFVPSELKIKNKWGRIEDSRTYGMDPENIRG